MKNLLYILVLMATILSCGETSMDGFIDLGKGISYKFIVKNDTTEKIEYGDNVTHIVRLESAGGNVLKNSIDSAFAESVVPLDSNYVTELDDVFWNVLLSMHDNDEVVFKGKARDIFPLDNTYHYSLKADDIVYIYWRVKLSSKPTERTVDSSGGEIKVNLPDADSFKKELFIDQRFESKNSESPDMVEIIAK